MYHWTDRKIRIHAFYCMLGISLLQYVHEQAKAAWTDLSVEQLLEELEQIKQFVLLYPPQGEKGSASHCLCALAADSGPASFGQDTGAGRAAYYPAWVIPIQPCKLLRNRPVRNLSPFNSAVNYR